MKIHIRKIRKEGIDQEESFAPDWVGLTRKDSIRFVVPVSIKAWITRAEDEVIVAIAATSSYESYCFRCLEDVKSDWTTEFTLSFEVEKQKEFIDISDDIRQELILNLPARILCQDNCRGLCIDCGVNLNKHKCQHDHSAVSN